MQLTPEEITKAKSFMVQAFSTSQRVSVWLEMAGFRVSRDYFGDAFLYALALMAQHIATIETRSIDGGDAGRITAKREGDLSVSFAGASSTDDGDLSATSYGQAYLSLLKQYSPRPGITGRVCLRGRR